MKHYTTSDLEKLSGVAAEKLVKLVHQGIFKPSAVKVTPHRTQYFFNEIRKDEIVAQARLYIYNQKTRRFQKSA